MLPCWVQINATQTNACSVHAALQKMSAQHSAAQSSAAQHSRKGQVQPAHIALPMSRAYDTLLWCRMLRSSCAWQG